MSMVRIDRVTKTASGKGLRVLSGATWYGAFLDSGLDQMIGQTVDADITTSEKYGATISKYRKVDPSPSTQAQGASKQPLPSGVAPYWMPFASNVCAHAISAGIVKEPADLKAWLLAARDAAEAGNNGDIGL